MSVSALGRIQEKSNRNPLFNFNFQTRTYQSQTDELKSLMIKEIKSQIQLSRNSYQIIIKQSKVILFLRLSKKPCLRRFLSSVPEADYLDISSETDISESEMCTSDVISNYHVSPKFPRHDNQDIALRSYADLLLDAKTDDHHQPHSPGPSGLATHCVLIPVLYPPRSEHQVSSRSVHGCYGYGIWNGWYLFYCNTNKLCSRVLVFKYCDNIVASISVPTSCAGG